MSIKKKIILSVGVFLAMLVAFVTGIVINKDVDVPKSTTPNNTITNNEMQKPTIYTYQPGEVELITGNSPIDFEYDPNVNSAETTTVKAYEYIFGRPNNAEDTMAITLKPIEAEGVTITYTYSDTRLNLNEEITASVKFEAQTIETKGADIYIYVLVTPTDAGVPVNFATSPVWNFGKATTISYEVNGETITETIVSGQDLLEPQTPTAPIGYYFDAWFTDAEFSNLATFPLKHNGQNMHARFANLPSDYIGWDSTTSSYFVKNSVDAGYSITQSLPTNLVIPATYDDGTHGLARVEKIEMASGNQGSGPVPMITSKNITMPCTIKEIGTFAFYMLSIDELKFDKGSQLETIEARAFGDASITTLDLSNCTKITTLGPEFGGSQISDIKLPNTIISLDMCNSTDGMFLRNHSIKSLNLEHCTKLTKISASAFAECINLTSVKLPNSLKEIEDGAFSVCQSLTTIEIPQGVTAIGNNVFSACEALTDISIPSSVTSIGASAFIGCSALTKLDLTKCSNLTNLGASAFIGTGLTNIDLSGCTSLVTLNETCFPIGTKSVILPISLTTIETKAFNSIDYNTGDETNLTALTKLDLSRCVNLATIKSDAFMGCDNITSFDLSQCTGLKEIGRAFPTTLQKIIFPSSLETITEKAFYQYTNLTTIDWSSCDKLTTIGDQAFSESGLTSLMLPSGVSLGLRTFALCSNLAKVTIENGVKSIGDGAFGYCTSLKTITIPGSVLATGRMAFFGCTGLTSVILEEGVTTITEASFYECTNLKSVKIPTSITSIEGFAFQLCTNLTDADISKCVGLTKIDKQIFYDCSSLTSVTIPVNVTSIGQYALRGCTNLTTLNILGSISSIEKYAFWNCSKLTMINLSAYTGLTTLEEGVFGKCSLLSTIVLPTSITTIGDGAFHNCSKLVNITIPASVNKIHAEAFSGSSVNTATFNDTSTWYSVADETNWAAYTEGTLIENINDYVLNTNTLYLYKVD